MASGKSNVNSIGFLEIVFQAVQSASYANLIQNGGSPITNIYVSLHTANPGVGGNQQTSEAAYPSYARVGVARTTGGWSIAGETISNVAAVTFPTSTGSPSEIETYVGIGTLSSGAGVLLYFGLLTSGLAIGSAGITPQFATGALTIMEA